MENDRYSFAFSMFGTSDKEQEHNTVSSAADTIVSTLKRRLQMSEDVERDLDRARARLAGRSGAAASSRVGRTWDAPIAPPSGDRNRVNWDADSLPDSAWSRRRRDGEQEAGSVRLEQEAERRRVE